MPCPEIRKTHLYISGEMNSRETSKFRKHLKTCVFCREEADLLRMAKKAFRNTADVPDETIRRRILREAGRSVTGQRTFAFRTSPWIRALAWATPALAAVTIIFLVSRPIGDEFRTGEYITDWEYEFYTETSDIAEEMDQLFSNRWMTVNIADGNESFLLDDLSLLSGEFNSIRSQIQNLFENMAGI